MHDESKRPKVGVAVFIYKDGTFLATKRTGSHGADTWSIPGGHLEFNESWEECARRETLEEVGVHLKNVRFLTATNDIFEADGKHYITIWMTADWESGEAASLEPDKILEVKWASFASLPQPLFEPCWANLRTALPDLFAKG